MNHDRSQVPILFSSQPSVKNKPEKAPGALLAEGWQPSSEGASFPDLLSCLKSGHAVVTSHLDLGKRKTEHWRGSQLVFLDYDNPPNLTWDQAKEHPFFRQHAVFGYTTPSHQKPWKGDRFRIVGQFPEAISDLDQYKRLRKGLQPLLPAEDDPACHNPVQAIYGNSEGEFHWFDLHQRNTFPMVETVNTTQRVLTAAGSWTANDRQKALLCLKSLPTRQIGCNTYPVAFKALCALVHEFGPEEAELIIDEADWRGEWDEEGGGLTAKLYEIAASRPEGGLRLGSLIRMTQELIGTQIDELQKQSQPTPTLTMSIETDFQLETARRAQIDKAQSQQEELTASMGKISHQLTPVEVLKSVPKHLPNVRLNLRDGSIQCDAGLISANQVKYLYLQFSTDEERWPKEATTDAVCFLAHKHAFDPVEEYLNKVLKDVEPLPMEQWARLDQHLLGIEDPIAARFLPRYLVGAVARVFVPGCDVRQTPVLIGPQWRGKTALGRILFGKDLFVEGIGKLDRDALMKSHTAWGVELAELDGVSRRSDQEKLKAFLSECSDVFRAPYETKDERHDRRFVFWATSNAPPLQDPTGSTRFVCISLPDAMLPLEWVEEHRDAIWARAAQQYLDGFEWRRVDEEERQLIASRNDEHRADDPWVEILETFFAGRSSGCDWEGRSLLPVTANDLFTLLEIPIERRNNPLCRRLMQAAAVCGWVKERRQVEGVRKEGYWPKEQ